MTLRPIPLNFITLYADLAQNVRSSSLEHGSVVTRKRGGRGYLYVVSKDGAERSERYLGPADNHVAAEEAEQLRHAAEQAKALRATVSALKQARFPSPALPLGRVLETIANAGLFERGVVLVGTAAYQTYAGIAGHYLPGGALMTNDADILVASLVAGDEPADLEVILKRADPTFRAHMSRDDKLPKVYRAANGFQVDILTKFGRGRKSPLLVDELKCAAEALTFMEYLAEESIEAVALYGTGILVRVPPPMRYAIHKLLIAQERRGLSLAKRQKDLSQARDLLDIFVKTDSGGLEDALEEARARGPSWKKNINASLKEIDRMIRQTMLPISLPAVSKSKPKPTRKRAAKKAAKNHRLRKEGNRLPEQKAAETGKRSAKSSSTKRATLRRTNDALGKNLKAIATAPVKKSPAKKR